MSLKRIKFFLLALLVFAGFLFVYGLATDRILGKGYKMVYLEPGCVIFGHNNGIYGDVERFSITKKYIYGKVGKENSWMKEMIKEQHISENPYGYFIIDKSKHTQKNKMIKEEFLKECKALKIKNCSLKYASGLDPVYDPYYWYVLLQDALGS